MDLGRKVPPPEPIEVPEWARVEGKPHLERNAKTGELRTDIPQNEQANNPPPYGYPLGPFPFVKPDPPVDIAVLDDYSALC